MSKQRAKSIIYLIITTLQKLLIYKKCAIPNIRCSKSHISFLPS